MRVLGQNKKITFGVLLGNFMQHYDSALYGFLSPFFAELFFPDLPPAVALSITFVIIPLSMFAKPFGGTFFGWLGDTYGRRQALSFSLIGMGVTALGFATLPFLWKSAMVLLLLRMVQHFFSAGEVVGGAIFLLESNDQKKGAFFSSLFNVSTIGGMILASFGIWVLSQIGNVKEGWWWLYLLGSGVAVLGFFFRIGVKTEKVPTTISIKQYPMEILSAAIVSGFSYMTFTYAFILMVGLPPIVMNVTKEEMMGFNTLLLILDAVLLPIFGFLGVKFGGSRVLRSAAFGALLFTVPIAFLLQSGTVGGIVAARVLVIVIGVAFGAPLFSWLKELVPKEVRYRVVGLGYALGAQFIGAPSAALATWSFHKTGSFAFVWIWWCLMAVLTIGVIQLREANVTVRFSRLNYSS